MHFPSVLTAATALFAVGMAAPQRGRPLTRPTFITRPGRPTPTTPTISSTTSTAKATTSTSTTIANPETTTSATLDPSTTSSVVIDPESSTAVEPETTSTAGVPEKTSSVVVDPEITSSTSVDPETTTSAPAETTSSVTVSPETTSSAVSNGTTTTASAGIPGPSSNGTTSTTSSFIPGPTPAPPACMPDSEAQIIADNFRQIIQGYTIEMAEAALTEDFVDYTSAVSIIVNKGGSAPKNLLVPIFTNRTQFMAGHGTQKGIPFETLNVWHDCNGTVSMRWWSSRSGKDQPKESAAIPVIGIAVLETVPAEINNPLGFKYRIHTLYSEFNTAAWLVNNGVFTVGPNVTVTPVSAVTKRDVPVTKREILEQPFDRRTPVHEARDVIKSLKAMNIKL